jgi:hypothetical protein
MEKESRSKGERGEIMGEDPCRRWSLTLLSTGQTCLESTSSWRIS